MANDAFEFVSEIKPTMLEMGKSGVEMQILFFIIYVAIGLLQYFAIQDGLTSWVGLPWLIAVPAAFVLGYIPIVGSVLGVLGASYVWKWSWTSAILLFCWPVVLFGFALLSQVAGSRVAALIRGRPRGRNSLLDRHAE